MTRRALLCIGGLLVACEPELGRRASLVDRPTVLAVLAEPPEAAPGVAVQYTLVLATPDGTASSPSASWSFCATPKLLTDDGAVSAACATGASVRAIGSGVGRVTGTTPADACSIFGPDVSSPDLRPRDPDVTGGFYQPVRVAAGGVDDAAFAFVRLRCDLANAPATAVSQFAASYVANRNPLLQPLVLTSPVRRAGRVIVRAAWTPSDAERFPVYDVATATLSDARESMRVAWYATAGVFEHDVTGVDATDAATFTEDGWTAPSVAGAVHLWAVLRDSRGGAAVGALTIAVGE